MECVKVFNKISESESKETKLFKRLSKNVSVRSGLIGKLQFALSSLLNYSTRRDSISSQRITDLSLRYDDIAPIAYKKLYSDWKTHTEYHTGSVQDFYIMPKGYAR